LLHDDRTRLFCSLDDLVKPVMRDDGKAIQRSEFIVFGPRDARAIGQAEAAPKRLLGQDL
jgi:hypothetical protein